MENLSERIDIINSFSILSEGRNKSLNIRKRNNLISYCLNFILILSLIGLILWSIFVELTNFPSKLNWARTSMILILSFSMLFNFTKIFYAKLLLKHLDVLEKTPSKYVNENSNAALQQILTANNKPLANNIILVSLAMIALTGACINFFMDREFVYYKFFIIPTLLFYFLLAYDVFKTYRKLKENINEVVDCQLKTAVNYS